MINVIFFQARAFYPYWILTHVFTLLTWRFLTDFESLVCWGNHRVRKFLGFCVNKVAQKINLSSNVLGRKIKAEAAKNLFQYLYSHSNLYWLTKGSWILRASHLVVFFPQLTAVPVWWFTIRGCLSGEARYILLSCLQWNSEGDIDPCCDTQPD